MKQLFFLKKYQRFFVASLAMLSCIACTQNQEIEWPQVTNETKPWSRWWWEGSAVQTIDIDSLLPQYQEAGLGGLEITPIYGVHGYEDRFKDFLSPEWVDIFLYTLQEAKQMGLGIDLANASGWPFGGPWVTSEHACKTMAHKTYRLKEGEKLKEPIRYKEEGFVRLAGHTPVRLEDLKEPVTANDNLQKLALDQVRYTKDLPVIVVTANNDKGECIDLTSKVNAGGDLDWVAPQGEWTICALFEGYHGKMVERAGPGGEGDVIDHFSAAAIDAYLQKFDEAFKDKDISYLRYYFNDSYEVDDARGESNWTPGFFDEFQTYRGYDLRHYLPALLGLDTPDKNARVLYDYRQTINDLLIDHYSTRWQHWAAKQGKGIRNQAHGSPANILDLYAVSDVPEIEGRDLVSIKAAPSVAHTEGKKLASSESATWLNEHFQSNLGDVKKALDLFFLGGVNHIFYHGTCFSPQDAPWPGWLFYAAVHFTPNNPFWEDFKYLNRYVTRVQSFLQDGMPDNDVLLYYNIADVMSEEGNRSLQHFSGLDRNMLQSSVRESAVALTEKGYSWDLISDRQILKTRVEGSEIVTPGARYKTILIPETQYIPYETMDKLISLVSDGATVVFYRNIPQSPAGMVIPEEKGFQFKETLRQLMLTGEEAVKCTRIGEGEVYLSNDITALMNAAKVDSEDMYLSGLQCIRRKSATGKYYFIVNTGEHEIGEWIPLQTTARSAAVFNPMTGEKGLAAIKPNGKQTEVYLHLNPNEAVIISTSDQNFTGDVYAYYQDNGQPVTMEGNWDLSFVQGGPQLPASVTIDTLMSWTDLPGEKYKAFSGTAVYRTIINDIPQADVIKLDLGDLSENASVYLNGEYVGTTINAPYQLYIASNQFKGQDELVVRVANSMANRIADMDKKGIDWKIFYNVNMAARKKENVKNGIFDASQWEPKPSGLFGPVTLTPVSMVEYK
jgi:hypothetical protein